MKCSKYYFQFLLLILTLLLQACDSGNSDSGEVQKNLSLQNLLPNFLSQAVDKSKLSGSVTIQAAAGQSQSCDLILSNANTDPSCTIQIPAVSQDTDYSFTVSWHYRYSDQVTLLLADISSTFTVYADKSVSNVIINPIDYDTNHDYDNDDQSNLDELINNSNPIVNDNPSTMTVPNLVGMAIASARAEITSAGFTVGTETSAHSDTVAINAVISQSPLANTQAQASTAIDLVVSLGPAPITVPNIVGMTTTDARAVITSAGFTVGTESSAHSDTVVVDAVISQTPRANTQALPSSAIDLVVSLGPAPVTVPNIVGMTTTDARAAITSAGFTVGTESSAHSDTVAVDAVISQTPLANTQALPSSAIDLVVSLGPASITVPNIVGMTITNARAAIINAGFIVGSETGEFSETVALDSVISQSPLANTLAQSNTSINIVKSLGRQDPTPPTAVTITPEHNSIIRNSNIIRIVFSETMETGTLIIGGSLFPQSDSGSWTSTNVTNDTLTIAPQNNIWDYANNATITIDADDLAGNSLNRLSLIYDIKDDNRVFVTSVSGTGDLSLWADAGNNTGLAAADSICQTRANAAGLPGEYRAWLSNGVHDAYCRLHNLTGKKSANCGLASLPVNAGPWVRTDGTPFSDRIDQLTARAVYTPISYDEFGNELLGAEYFTGTLDSGAQSGSTCTDWTNATSGTGGIGISDFSGYWWTRGFASTCSQANHHLSCFQTGPGPDLPNFQNPLALKVFLTSTSGTGNLGSWTDAGGNTGIAAADAICKARASAAELPNANRFIAWISDDSNSAATRITRFGPWARLDGIVVAQNKTDLLDGRISAAIFQTEAGNYAGEARVHTGTNGDGTSSGLNCANWTNGTTASQGTAGHNFYGGENWSSARGINVNDCSSTRKRLFCFEN